MGKSQDAVTTLEKAVNFYPRFSRLYFDLAEAYKISGNYKEAVKAYDKIIQMDPGGKLAKEALQKAKSLKPEYK